MNDRVSKISVEEAWSHVKALWSDAEYILPYYGKNESVSVYLGNSRAFSMPLHIDWPSGVDRWPQPEPAWRDAVWPDDWGKECRFSDDSPRWSRGLLRGKSPRSTLWCDDDGGIWPHCQVRVEPEEMTC